MNKGIYRLVFSAVHGLWMAVGENVRGHAAGSGKRVRRAARYFLLLLGSAALPVMAGTLAPNTIPTGLAVTTGSHTSINAPVVNPANAAGQLLAIQQGNTKAILQGTNFNIGSASQVLFNHTGGAGSATLVRITGPKSVIEGALNSPNGDIYLLNQNGILFGNGARVNVHGLVASALDIKDSDFLNDLGHLYPYTDGGRAAYAWGGDAAGFATSLVQLEPDARIKAALGGSVMLFAPKVINQGSIETSEGQVALAAGAKVYLSYAPDHTQDIKDNQTYSYTADSPYRALAGVLVEVDPYQITNAGGQVTTDLKSSVVNDISGRILAQRGNVTMASFLVNQSGRVIATTSVAQKGSIRLLARDQKIDTLITGYDQNGHTRQLQVISATRTGELVFGENSDTMILPEHAAGAALAIQHLSSAQTGEPTPQSGEKSFLDTVVGALAGTGSTVTDEQVFNPPTLEAIGRNITVQDGSSIVAPGGYINLSAQINGERLGGNSNAQANTRLYLGKNTLIDASGLKDVAVSSDRNFVEVLLTSNDLQDDPLNKNGFLYHKNAWFDIRHLPNTGVANLAGYIKQIPRVIGEKLTVAGTVKLGSEGDLVQRTGSVVDVSGGTLKYTAGTHKETWLLDTNGKAYALSSAPTGVVFTGFLGNSNFIQSQEHAYTQGMATGTITMNSVAMALNGQLRGAATYGEYQRSSANLGGSLTLNLGNVSVTRDPLLNRDVETLNLGKADVDILNNPSALADIFTASDTLPAANSSKTLLDAAMLNRSGFENLSVNTGGNIRDAAALNLAVGSKLALNGANIAIFDNIVARGGKVTLTADSTVTLGNGAQIDVSGLWVNDYLDPATASGRIVTKGGNVNIIASTGDVLTGQGSLIDVSGGGWLKSSGKVSNGDAGSISIATQIGQVAPALNGELRGYALGVGGSLSLTAPFVTIGTSGLGDASEMWLTPAFFQNGGFTRYNLTGRDGVLVRSGSQVNVAAKNYQMNNNYVLAKTGGHVADFAKTVWLADYLRSSTSLTLATQKSLIGNTPAFAASGIGRGSVVVQTGATLQVDSHGNRSDSNGNPTAPRIELSGWDNLVYVDGTLKADGGTISLNMKGDPGGDKDDSDFNASQAIWLGKNARLQAAGYAQLIPGSTGLRAGTVYDGGTIELTAQKGYIVAETGSKLDVSGGNATLDILSGRQYLPTTVASNGGTINLFAREGMLLDATMQAAAPGALGGSLNIDLGRGDTNSIALNPGHYPGYNLPNDNYLPDQKWTIDVVQNSGSRFSHGLRAGDTLQSAAGGIAKVAADSINSSGFSKAVLKSEDKISFNGDVALNLPNSLRLDAPVIESTGTSHVTLNAPDVMLSNVQLFDADTAVRTSHDYIAPVPFSGLAALNINAQLLDLRGQFSLSGFSETHLNSSGDIRLTGFSNTNNTPVGELRTTGTLDMTARQIYPTSLSAYTLSVEGAGGRAVFHGTGSHDTVLSAGGTLTVNAETIAQGGVLLAPFGTIALNASQNLTLENGSLTSVSASGAMIPFGYTSRDGLDYLYSFGTGVTNLTAPPERAVKLSAPNVTQATGSVVDISSGGDLYAYEWVPGTGGSADVLANGAKQSAFNVFGSSATNTWAIMPTSNSTYASFDTQYWNGSSIHAGDAVYLSGAPVLAAGYYTLLPARYALLPGAMLVSAVSGHQDMIAGQVLAQNDGSSLVSGNLAAYTSSGYVATSRTGGFVVRSGSVARTLAEYKDTLASSRYASDNNSMKTVDAGRFSVSATNSLILNGTLQALHDQTSGRGAEVDVATPNLMVVAHGAQTGSVAVDGQTYLAVDENTLSGMNAASLLLGGTRSNGVANVVSSEVRVGANASVSGPEVILAATGKVLLQNSAKLSGIGSGAPSRDLTIGSASVGGDGALLRVSGGDKVNLTRNNTGRSRGDLVIESGVTVHGGTMQKDVLGNDVLVGGSVQLDATRGMSVAGALELGSGAALTLAAGRISLGSPDKGAQVTDGLWLTQNQFGSLAQAGSLALHSYSTLDFYGEVSFGSSTLDLTLQAAGISGYDNHVRDNKVCNTNITARQLTLTNPDGAAFVVAPELTRYRVPALGNGNLQINAATIVTGQNTFRLAGFGQSTLTSSGDIVAKNNGTLDADGALTLSAQRMTTSGAVNQTYLAHGALVIEQNGVFNPSSTQQSAGANLTFSGVSVTHQGSIELPGGNVTLEATGARTNDDVTLAAGSQILAKGSTFTLYDQSVALPAGSVTLVSQSGNIHVASGAGVNVSSAPGGDSGKLSLYAANGTVDLLGTLGAAVMADTSGNRGAGGQVDVDILKLSNLSDFSETLAHLHDFSGMQNYRVRTGDVMIASGDQIKTSRFSLSADAGAITVQGTVDASGDKGGGIEFYAKNDMTVMSGAKLLARGYGKTQSTAGTLGRGGSVILSSDNGMVKAGGNEANGNLISGALIDVSGNYGKGGQVILRASRTGADGVKVDAGTTGAVTGAAAVSVEAVKVYDASVIDTALQNTIASDTNSFAGYVAANPLGFSLTRDGVAASLMPGIEVRSSGDLTLSNDWVIGTSSVATPKMPGGGILTLRAAGNLLLDNNLGYEQYKVTGNTVTARTGSWSYRLVAGADASTVNPEAVQAGAGSIQLTDGKYVRTGSGFIDAVAGQDILLGANSAIYTEGTPDAVTKTGFSALAINFSIYKELYPATGGDIHLNALRDIVGQADTSQTANTWLYRAALRTGVNNPQVRWWSRFDKFANGVGALGGGDVSVHAGGNIDNLQFASASNGRMGGDKTQSPDVANLTVNGGGDVHVKAGGDILDALLVTGKGVADVQAGKSASAQFELMDSNAKIHADGNVTVTQVSNPTIMTPAITSLKSPANIFFYSYGKGSAVNAVSATGDVTLGGSTIYPGTLYAAAPNGNVTSTGFVLFPSASGNATLLAGHNINVSLNMSDVAPATLPQVLTTLAYDGTGFIPDLTAYVGSAAHTSGLLHLADTAPARFYAGNNVVFDPNTKVILPKAVEVYAGHDVVDPNLVVQNNRVTDVSIIEAGGNIRYSEPARLPQDGSIVASAATLQVAGPGRLHLVAGKNIDLGSAEGVRSVGDLYDPYLSPQGADIMVRPGSAAGGINYTAMISAYLDPLSAGDMAAIYLPQLVNYLENRQGVSGLSESDALARFKTQDINQQSQFINTVFFAELRAGGRDAINPKSASLGNYTRAERAILRMFPDFTTNTALVNQPGSLMSAFKGISKDTISSPGDLQLFYSQIRSERGGRIELLVPGGMINAGLAVSGTLNKPATDLGIVSVRGGEINAFVRNNFQVNQSRVFTLGGSDLMLYSALADIDAGRGAKTSSATPPPVLRIKNGQVFYDYSGAVSGSGIAALTATGSKPGTVDLFAPYGEINAGEAGIRSAGNINLGASHIVGAENISSGGLTSGVPGADTSGLSLSVGGMTDAISAGKSGDQMAQAQAASQLGANKDSFMPTIISVEVTGLGDEEQDEKKDKEKSI